MIVVFLSWARILVPWHEAVLIIPGVHSIAPVKSIAKVQSSSKIPWSTGVDLRSWAAFTTLLGRKVPLSQPQSLMVGVVLSLVLSSYSVWAPMLTVLSTRVIHVESCQKSTVRNEHAIAMSTKERLQRFETLSTFSNVFHRVNMV